MGQEAVCMLTAMPSRWCSHTHGRGEVDGLAVDRTTKTQGLGDARSSSPSRSWGAGVYGSRATIAQGQVQTRATCRK